MAKFFFNPSKTTPYDGHQEGNREAIENRA